MTFKDKIRKQIINFMRCLGILTVDDFYSAMAQQNRIVERKLSTFALHQKVFPQFKGINRGKKIAIIATGPSLAKFKPMPDVVYIGVNRACQFKKIHFNYFFVQDFSGQTPTYINEAINLPNCIKFIGLTCEDSLPEKTIPDIFATHPNTFQYRTDWENIRSFKTRYSYDLSTTALGCGGTVVLPALQFALWTHPDKIFLVGCDTSTAGYFDLELKNSNFLIPNELIKRYREMHDFAKQYYPDIEICSINPVGLKGIFTDEYQV